MVTNCLCVRLLHLHTSDEQISIVQVGDIRSQNSLLKLRPLAAIAQALNIHLVAFGGIVHQLELQSEAIPGVFKRYLLTTALLSGENAQVADAIEALFPGLLNDGVGAFSRLFDHDVLVAEEFVLEFQRIFGHPNMSFRPLQDDLNLFPCAQLGNVTKYCQILAQFCHVVYFERQFEKLVRAQFLTRKCHEQSTVRCNHLRFTEGLNRLAVERELLVRNHVVGPVSA